MHLKVFKMNKWKYVNEFHWFCERLDFKHTVEKRKLQFLSCIARTIVIRSCRHVFASYSSSQQFSRLCNKYDIDIVASLACFPTSYMTFVVFAEFDRCH